MTRRLLACAAAIVISTAAAAPARADFSRVAVGLRTLGFQRTWIPFLGFARMMVRAVQPNGVHDFQLAVYENSPPVTAVDLERMVRTHMGKSYAPLVRVHSSRKGEAVFIYARPGRSERLIELLILAHEREETVLVRLIADAEVVGREIGEPMAMRRMASR